VESNGILIDWGYVQGIGVLVCQKLWARAGCRVEHQQMLQPKVRLLMPSSKGSGASLLEGLGSRPLNNKTIRSPTGSSGLEGDSTVEYKVPSSTENCSDAVYDTSLLFPGMTKSKQM